MRTIAFVLIAAALQSKPYRLPSTDLKQPLIWGSVCEVPDGPSLAFGGQDQQAEDGNPHTRVKVDGKWVAIHEQLRAANPNQALHDAVWALRNEVKDSDAELRAAKLRNQPASPRPFEMGPLREKLRDHPRLKPSRIDLEILAESLDAEPAPRALSPIAYDAKTKLFVVFGGDHFDYLTNDTWVFDPAAKRWTQRHPKTAPPPRANHKLQAAGDGTVVLTGGYTYTSSTDYVGGQYRDLGDGEWTYDIATETWSGAGVSPESRTYRTGRLHPSYFLDAPASEPRDFAALPANTWVSMKPPRMPALNRDWGSVVIDPDRDMLLRWAGGHSAHGGTDVLHYHLSTNRWELSDAVEFPLGQLYSNTEYPEGVNFNRRPWITGHTYQSYGVDPRSKKMLFVGRRSDTHVYDPDRADWVRRFPKPKEMSYGDCFYTLTLTPTPEGLFCWTNQGKLFRFEQDWVEFPTTGEKLPGSVVDNSTLTYDAKRKRLLFARKSYGDKTDFDGVLHAVDVKTGVVTVLKPAGLERAGAIPYLCQLRYDPTNDLVFAGCTLPPDADGFRRTPAYDCAADAWISLKVGGDDPSGKKGRNVSLGLVYDARRKLWWAVDAASNVFVLRFDRATADPRPL